MDFIIAKVKAFFNFLLSLVTDKDWDGDAAKVFGFGLMVAGVVGFFLARQGFEWLVGFGATMVGTGKWAEEKNTVYEKNTADEKS